MTAAPTLGLLGGPRGLGLELLRTRTSVSLRHLRAPGPDAEQLREVVSVAIRVPDHGNLAPWRMLSVRGDARAALGETFADAARAAGAPEQAELWQRVPQLAPVVVCVVSSPRPAKVPDWEQVLSCGALCQNLLLAAHALGFGGQWLTGWPAYDAGVARALGLAPGERVAGFLFFGTAGVPASERRRPPVEQVLREWTPA